MFGQQTCSRRNHAAFFQLWGVLWVSVPSRRDRTGHRRVPNLTEIDDRLQDMKT